MFFSANKSVIQENITTESEKNENNIKPHLMKNKTEKLKLHEKNVRNEHNKKYFITRDEIIWKKVVGHIIFHSIGVYTLITFPYIQHYKTSLYLFTLSFWSIFGVTAGIHRYWAHKAYKAKLPLRLFLAFCFLMTGQLQMDKWILIHRTHHKFADTDADPHNPTRGFFYSHMGWLMIKRPREVREKFKVIDMRDIEADEIVTFCSRYFLPIVTVIELVLIAIPVYMWNESLYYSFFAQYLRVFIILHLSMCGNSVAHIWGYKPYNKNISAVDTRPLNIATFGEGWHNHHHAFPNDYRTPLIDMRLDLIANTIELFAKIGWAYDLKQTSGELAKNIINNKGDGSFKKVVNSKLD